MVVEEIPAAAGSPFSSRRLPARGFCSDTVCAAHPASQVFVTQNTTNLDIFPTPKVHFFRWLKSARFRILSLLRKFSGASNQTVRWFFASRHSTYGSDYYSLLF